MNAISTPQPIAKELISELKFPAESLSKSPEDHKRLMDKLNNATSLGNIDHLKCRIVFQDAEGVKVVETTIWATADKNIVLKQGVTIPIHRILDVNFY